MSLGSQGLRCHAHGFPKNLGELRADADGYRVGACSEILKDEVTLKSRGPIPVYYESLYAISLNRDDVRGGSDTGAELC